MSEVDPSRSDPNGRPGDGGGPRLLHPLMGADPVTLARSVLGNGPVPPDRWIHVALATAASLMRAPFSLAERLACGWRAGSGSGPERPLFIVGHWRSGTTFLYTLLSRSPELGFIPPFATALPWDMLGLARALEPILEKALPSDRYIDRVPVEPDSPQEDEIALANMQTISFYHGLYFPRRFEEHFRRGIFFDGCREEEVERWKRRFRLFVAKLHRHQGGRRLLIKNPVYTARVAMLAEMWPEARFVHIHRNPYIVYQSTLNFYRKLFPELALQPWADAPVERVILESYPRMMDRLLADSAALPEERFVEIRFDELESDPLEVCERIYDRLGIEGLGRARPHFRAYLESVREYRKNVYRFPDEQNARVRSHWGDYIERWGYEPPT